MLYSIGNREDSKKIEELASLENQAKELHLRDKLGEQNFREDMKKLYETFAKTNKDTPRDITKTMLLTSEENIKALTNLNDKTLEIRKDKGILSSYLLSLF